MSEFDFIVSSTFKNIDYHHIGIIGIYLNYWWRDKIQSSDLKMNGWILDTPWWCYCKNSRES